MPLIQTLVQHARSVFPRGWAPLLSCTARILPALQTYRARLSSGDHIWLDLRESMCYRIFFEGGQSHELGAEKVFHRFLRPGDTVFDIGANIGYYTRLLSRLVGPSGLVCAFEPMPAALSLLEKNSSDLPNVRVLPLALSDVQGDSDFYVRRRGDRSSLRPGAGAKVVQVRTDTLDHIASEMTQVCLIKIDVEGLELEVLRGAENIISRHRPVVYFEYLAEVAKNRGFGLQTFETYFSRFNYSLNWVNHSASSESLLSPTPSNYLVAIPKDRTESVS